jgi:hypothetical protein
MSRKAAGKPTPVPTPPATETVDDAFRRLLPIFGNGQDTAERLNTAVRSNNVRLFVDGAVVDPHFFATHLRITARTAADGRWHATVEATRALDKPPNQYSWAMSSHDLDRIVRREKAGKHAGGRPQEHSHEELLIEGAAVLFQKFGGRIPANYSGNRFAEDVDTSLSEKRDPAARGPGDTLLRQILSPLLKRLKSQN